MTVAVSPPVGLDTVTPPRLGMVAGEASGDLLGSLMLQGMQRRWPSLQPFGIGGPQLLAQGFETWWPQERLAVRGYVEVLRHYREIAGIRRSLTAQLLQRHRAGQLDGFVGVDAPDFNLGLEQTLRREGVRTVHFVCPSIWAWRAGRIEQIKRSVDHMLCVFPFEPALLKPHGVAATYVGHPLADAIPLIPPDQTAARVGLGLAPGRPVVALLPGSRASEWAAMAKTFVEAAALMKKTRPELQFVLPMAPGREVQWQALDPAVRHTAEIVVTEGRSHEVLAACDVTLIASGTATLEAALFKRPMVIAYKMNAMSYQLMKRMGLQPWIGLPNILAREFLVPERIQAQASPAQLAADTLAWLDAPAKAAALQDRFTTMHHDLRCDTATRATEAMAHVLGH
jgi:lipid-A-disaccharide synthase